MACNLGRLIRFKLVIPILRGRGSARYTARGVMVGVGSALTPFFGLQMLVAVFVWGAIKVVRPQWDFSLVIALAWTWVSNIFTLPLFFYVFIVTGKLMLGRWDELTGFWDFVDRLDMTMTVGTDRWDATLAVIVAVFEEWGEPLLLGSIPWTAGLAWLSYVLTLRYLRSMRATERARLGKAAA